jgi:Protein of unknown function (DUF1329)
MERCFARWAVSVVAWLAISATNAEWSRSAQAKVSPAEAERLKSALTPLGAERAGNASGTIPAWNGGYTQIPPGWHGGEPRPALFSQEKPLLTITSGNVRDYVDRLPAGAVALLKKFPDYRMEIYPTHRTAAAPASVYESVFRNATHAEAAPEGIRYGVVGAAGGIPFPIPSNGFEVVWNHLLAFWGPAREGHFSTYVASGRGTIDLVSAYRETADFPYYYPQATPQSYGGYYFKTRRIDDQPPAKAGEGYLAWQPIDTARYNYVAWRYLPGEHRVRRGPPLAYDAPDSDAAGFESLDEYYVFFGGPDRYDFRLLGKREMYIPYNNNLFYLRPVGEILGPQHANQNDLRYELHRVWAVEGTLAPGQHHVAPRRRLYIDEDTWFAVYSDSYDEDGRLWKFGQGTMYAMPDVPAVILGSEFVYDLLLGGYAYSFSFNDDAPYRVTEPHQAGIYTPDSLASGSSR